MTNTNPQDPPIEPIGAEPPVEPATEPVVEPTDPTEPAEPHGTNGEPTDPTDWKATSRKWEKQSKENKEALDALEASSKAAIEALQKEIADLKASNARADAIRSAAKAANVDEEVLSRMKGDTPEEIAENARILAAATPKASNYPPISDGGAGGQAYGMTLEQINQIKDPMARVMARAQYPNAK